MSRPSGALRTSTVSVVAFFVAALVGRQTVLPGTEMSLVWPAAGIAGVWISAHAHSRWVAVDLVLLFAASSLANALTGAGLATGLWFGLAAVVQAVVLVAVLHRWAPGLCGFADRTPDGLTGVREVGVVLVGSAIAAGAAAFVGPASQVALESNNWWVLLSWVVRGSGAVLVVLPLALVVPYLWRTRRTAALATLSGRQWLETLVLYVATAGGVTLVFDVNGGLPLPFLLVATCVWAGARFETLIALLHSVLLSTVVVVLTLRGDGPFATIAEPETRALVTQTYLLLAVLVTIALSVARREAAVLTAALRASEKTSQAQAQLMAAIVDSMGDGITVLAEDDRIMLRNPAATRIVGAPILAADGNLDVAKYGLRHPDGRPIAADETPMERARTSEEVVTAEMLYRHPDFERHLEVTVTPLPEAEPPVVVAVYHDVTAERREREELAGFAGVVAHDLLNPLTVVEGWTTMLAADLSSGTPVAPEVQLQHLARIQSAGRRMRDLIDDLLSYTTARDLAIDPVPVDTAELARDVALARVEAARATEVEEPDIRVGPLPAVLAEPVLLRQVLDNLIGNAVKYVAPGVRPVIEITGRRTSTEGSVEPLVELTVTDNGIGIPAGQHATVFETFHRAHPAAYRGTGLGLSIVKRVVERHGGSVRAEDRPEGGTVITLVLPAAREDFAAGGTMGDADPAPLPLGSQCPTPAPAARSRSSATPTPASPR